MLVDARNERFFLRAAHFFDGGFTTLRVGSVATPTRVHKPHHTMRSCVTRTSSIAMCFQTAFQIICHTSVVAAVFAQKNVDIKHNHSVAHLHFKAYLVNGILRADNSSSYFMKYTLFPLLAVVLLVGAGCETTDTSGDAYAQKKDQQVEETHSEGTDSMIVEDTSMEADEEATTVSDELNEEAINALGRALDDEYKARTTYDVVMAEFGEVRPFVNIREAEQKHIDSLLGLYDTYGLEAPENVYTESDIPAFDSVDAACEAGVEAEIVNAALYRDDLLPVVEEYDDITAVFTNLMDASQENHLPAFERCGGGGGQGNNGR